MCNTLTRARTEGAKNMQYAISILDDPWETTVAESDYLPWAKYIAQTIARKMVSIDEPVEVYVRDTHVDAARENNTVAVYSPAQGAWGQRTIKETVVA